MKPLFKTETGRVEYYKAYEKTLALWPVSFQEKDLDTGFGRTHVIVSGSKASLHRSESLLPKVVDQRIVRFLQ
jgi:hypothetical protein